MLTHRRVCPDVQGWKMLAMAKTTAVSSHGSRHAKEFMKTITGFTGKHNPYQIFRDFVALAARAISNQQFFFQQQLEDEYQAIAGKYTREELDKICGLLGIASMALAEEHQDFLGHCYMSLDFGNAHAGQFFTPYSISSLMAGLQVADLKILPDKGFISVQEPAMGAGGMLIAFAEAFSNKGFSPQTQMICQGIEIDQMVAEMAYVQLSLLDIPAEVCVGNTLSNTIYRRYFTPAFRTYDWFDKWFGERAPVAGEQVVTSEERRAEVAVDRPSVKVERHNGSSIAVRVASEQIALF